MKKGSDKKRYPLIIREPLKDGGQLVSGFNINGEVEEIQAKYFDTSIEETEGKNKELSFKEKEIIDAWLKGEPFYCTNNQTVMELSIQEGKAYYIRANFDGSEDLVWHESKNDEFHFVRKLVGSGGGKYAYLLRHL